MPTDEGLMMLVEVGHVSCFERGKYGFVGHDVVPFDRLVGAIRGELLHNGRFPRQREKYDAAEGMWITREAAGFTVWVSRALADSPNVVAERGDSRFSSPEDAVRFYLKWACNLPGILDGVRFV